MLNEQQIERTAYEQLGQFSQGEKVLSIQEDGHPVRRLYRLFASRDETFESRAYEARNRVLDYIENPRNFVIEYRMKEAMTTPDFPLIFGDTLNRSLLSAYNAPVVNDWRQYIAVGRVRDFRTNYAYALSGGDAALDKVTELGEYKERAFRETSWSFKIGKYGNRFAFSFEFFLMDDLDAFRNTPRLLARGARRRENRFATSLFVDANGPHASLYKTNHTNPYGGAAFSNVIVEGVTPNPALTRTSLQAALDMLLSVRDENNEPIEIDMPILVIPPTLVEAAARILDPTEVIETVGSVETRRSNPLRNRVRVVINPLIPIIASTANGNTSWFLFADPNNGRPAVQVSFLAGFEQPQLFEKMPDQRRIGEDGGGGGVNIMDGDFRVDELQNKVRMFIGGTQMDPRMTLASNGSGT